MPINPDNSGITEHCREWLINADKLGISLVGMRLFDTRLAYEYAKSIEGVNTQKIGTIGLSMGGELSLYLAAIEPNIRFCISGGFLTTFESLLIKSRAGCHCYSIRNWYKWLEMTDIVGCVAPRPLLIQKGNEDPWFMEEDVERAVKAVKEIYEAIGKGDNFLYQTYPGEHVLNVIMAEEWLNKLL